MPNVNADPIPHIGASWAEQLANVLDHEEFNALLTRIGAEYQRGNVYPSWDDIFRAFLLTPFDRVRVVILGQDPYHGPAQANGLSFSVPAGKRLPPSLRNIFKEQVRDLGVPAPLSGDLSRWAEQGVLLLNTSLTVAAGKAGSHRKIGWERFTDAVIKRLSSHGRPGIIFLLWGAFAEKKEKLIDSERHHILKAPHPSPLSAYRGFIGCGHFSKVNEILKAQGEFPIDWSLQ